jgi:flagellar biosynthesis protein FliP
MNTGRRIIRTSPGEVEKPSTSQLTRQNVVSVISAETQSNEVKKCDIHAKEPSESYMQLLQRLGYSIFVPIFISIELAVSFIIGLIVVAAFGLFVVLVIALVNLSDIAKWIQKQPYEVRNLFIFTYML